ncbi:membrane protein [Candidatus Magnetobacterium bavaricum]|uniref:Membrane protein n=1 Tax=Candidatus Magnetobacterium bavaricum TaxID=29290 RepID=A0A0F3GVL1_9BACT|nr:membrane protein [Candidatus Magnetobacterium bavaricum]
MFTSREIALRNNRVENSVVTEEYQVGIKIIIMDKQIKKDAAIGLLTILTVLISVITIPILIPIAFIWSIGTLSNLKIAVNYVTWFASVFLMLTMFVVFRGTGFLFPAMNAEIMKTPSNRQLKKVAVFVLIGIGIIILLPTMFIWSLNKLFGLNISINYTMYFASAFLILILYITFNTIGPILSYKTAEEIAVMNRKQLRNERISMFIRRGVFLLLPIIFIWSLDTLFVLNIPTNYKTWFSSILLMLIAYMISDGLRNLFSNLSNDEVENSTEKYNNNKNKYEYRKEYNGKEEHEDGKMGTAKLFLIIRQGPQPSDIDIYKGYVMDNLLINRPLHIVKETQIHVMCVDKKIEQSRITTIVDDFMIEKGMLPLVSDKIMHTEDEDEYGYPVTLILVGSKSPDYMKIAANIEQ